jgi:hypothetical protein
MAEGQAEQRDAAERKKERAGGHAVTDVLDLLLQVGDLLLRYVGCCWAFTAWLHRAATTTTRKRFQLLLNTVFLLPFLA